MSTRDKAILILGLVIAVFFAGVAFSRGDNSATVEPIESPTIKGSVPPRPELVPAGTDVIAALANSGAPWNGETIGDSTDYTDGSVNLYRRTVYFRTGSISADWPDGGGLYYVIVRSGMGTQCGDPAVVSRAYAQLTQSLGLPMPDEGQVQEMQKAWKDKSTAITEVLLPGVQVIASGGCLPFVSVKAL